MPFAMRVTLADTRSRAAGVTVPKAPFGRKFSWPASWRQFPAERMNMPLGVDYNGRAAPVRSSDQVVAAYLVPVGGVTVSIDLLGHTALISGGLGDIGRAIAVELAAHGADIAICDRSRNSAERLVEEIGGLGRRCRVQRLDVTDSEAVRHWIVDLDATFGLPDLIVPNAAIVDIKPFGSLDAQYWRQELSVNLDGAFHVAEAATSLLVARRRAGRVVFIGSWAADHVHTDIPAYCVAKAGLRMLAKCMAAAFAAHGILVNEVAPGYVDAGLAARFMEKDPSVRETSRREVPIGLLIEPREVARQVLHLLDPENRHMTGSTLLMDGGLSLVRPLST